MDAPDSCAGVQRALREHASLDDPVLAAHLASCSVCAVLVEGGASLGHALADAEDPSAPRLSLTELDASYATLEERLRAPPSPLEAFRQRPTWLRSLALAGAGLGLAALVFAGLRRVDFGVYPLPRLLASVVALLAAVLAASSVVLRPLHRRPVPSWLLGIVAGFALVAPALIASLPAAHQDHPTSLLGTGADLLPRALGCLSFGMAFALALVAVAWLVERSGLRRRASFALGLIGAGALGNLVLVLHCPMVAPVHKLAGHASVSVVLLLAAGLGLWKLVGRRSR